MMFDLVLLSSAWLIVSVNSHPLIQNRQPYPVTNYQQNIYRPYSDAFLVQPSNINHYPQQHSVQTPLPPYQTVPIPSLTEQVTQIYWDKLLSNPNLRRILDPNNIRPHQYGNDIQTYSHPYNTGGVVNNYIIVPPEYLKINETDDKAIKPKRVRNEPRTPVKETITSNQRKKKVVNGDRVNIRPAKLSNNKIPRKVKQDVKSWNFNTDNIKCFTPADVLGNEKYQPEMKVNKNEEVKKQCHGVKSTNNSKPSTNCQNKNSPQNSIKTNENKIKKKSTANENKKMAQSNAAVATKQKKSKQSKKAQKVCKCKKKDELPDCKVTIVEDIPQICDQDIEDLLLSNLLQQGCANLENRRTRNSKTDATIKDFRNMYPELPGDLSKSLTWYMNDYFSPQSFQYGANFNTFQGDKYPFDFTQIYQIPNYSNADVSKPKGNTEKNRNTRRKKKKKKNSKPKTRKENESHNDDSNRSQIPEKNIEISQTNTQFPEINNQILETTSQPSKATTLEHPLEINYHIPEKSAKANLESPIKVTSLIDETKPIEIVSGSTDELSTETVFTKSTSSMNEVIEFFNKPVQDVEEIPEEKDVKTYLKSMKNEDDNFEITYETQIPNSIVAYTNNENNNEINTLKPHVRLSNEYTSTFNSPIFNEIPKFTAEDKIYHMLMNDYYPDFRADNHAYLVSDEEIDVRDIHDRYFYVSDRNIDSREVYSPEQDNNISNKRIVYTEDNLDHHNVIRHNDNKNKKEKDKSQEVVFRTPPGLEIPDFITRKINRDRQDSTEIYYQHSLEDDFDRFNLDNFADNSDNVIKTAKASNESKQRFVETVYAKSKVVKYGQAQDLNKSFKTNFPKAEDGTLQNDGEKTVIIAKSLRPEDYW